MTSVVAPYNATQLGSTPGIQRDGTIFASQSYIDGQWVRFYNGMPKKIGGYSLLINNNKSVIRHLAAYPYQNTVFIFVCDGTSVLITGVPSALALPSIGQLDASSVVTPNALGDASTFSSTFFTAQSDLYPVPQFILSVTNNLSSVADQNLGLLYYCPINSDNTQMELIYDAELASQILVSGGIVFISPFLVGFGKDGMITWNNPEADDPINSWSYQLDTTYLQNVAYVANTNIIDAANTIGNNAPTGIFWSLNNQMRISFVPNYLTELPAYVPYVTVLSESISIISAKSVVQIGQSFYWVGIDCFYIYNGSVTEIPNATNKLWFFETLDITYSNKVVGVAVPAFSEIWWHFCDGKNGATENNRAIIYNYSQGIWYDTVIARSAGLSANVLRKPLMADSSASNNLYGIWQHEVGFDKKIANELEAIPSSFVYNLTTLYSQQGSQNRKLFSRRIEYDFKMTGNMTVSLKSCNYPAEYPSLAIPEGPYTFDSSTTHQDVTSMNRLMTAVFTSNCVGGNYQMGNTYLDWKYGSSSK